MAALTSVKNGGAWRAVKLLYVRNGGAWRTVKQAWVKSGGVWRLIFAAVTNPLPGASASSTAVSPGTAIADLTFKTDGTVTASNDTPAGWTPSAVTGIGSNYWVRATVTAGATPSISATGSWLALSADRTWRLVQSTNGTTTSTLTIEIASDAAGTNIVATGTSNYFISVERTP